MALNRGWSYQEQVGPSAAGQTVLGYLSSTRTHSTAAEWANRVCRGEGEIDGAGADAAAVLRLGQTVVWHRPPWDEPEVPTQFAIVHEDEELLAFIDPDEVEVEHDDDDLDA